MGPLGPASCWPYGKTGIWQVSFSSLGTRRGVGPRWKTLSRLREVGRHCWTSWGTRGHRPKSGRRNEVDQSGCHQATQVRVCSYCVSIIVVCFEDQLPRSDGATRIEH
ncbi:uncharacterized protein BP01DRAFT_169138 [Aspergillus saccharolyticus JOP 1030-1]|uniref:Uncharacterized protein n=1 Tax=Aspergillus saccharolyticus JOP 1030-1 TaxID=1450539 RepID=A0A318Z2C7_9EURO|nr:hypothetical protein BP01DRAFT_169138 [Aspergillus saccharolyticus JOP 1030-1]PYH41451.1 hypothetical protein BP01DRAFT_169138 [Aspergillus saccharolyticus JOP 1030-1]